VYLFRICLPSCVFLVSNVLHFVLLLVLGHCKCHFSSLVFLLTCATTCTCSVFAFNELNDDDYDVTVPYKMSFYYSSFLFKLKTRTSAGTTTFHPRGLCGRLLLLLQLSSSSSLCRRRRVQWRRRPTRQQRQFAIQTGCRSRKNVVSLSLGIDWAAELDLSQ